MRERRWESKHKIDFDDLPEFLNRLATLGLKPASLNSDLICYIEDFTVQEPNDFEPLSDWPTEDLTMVHTREHWQGDFYLLAGAYHSVYQEAPGLATYCSISHPWGTDEALVHHSPQNMFWLGFRDRSQSFIRIRLETIEVIPPGETHTHIPHTDFLEERHLIFKNAIDLLGLSIDLSKDQDTIKLSTSNKNILFLNSWPDAFGPSQFEYNSSDPYEFLVPASRLATSCRNNPITVRSYLTGFSESVLEQFSKIDRKPRSAYRCSLHCPLEDLSEILNIASPDGRVYATLCEFQTKQFLPENANAWVIIGLVGHSKGFQIEVRLNRSPVKIEEMTDWLETLLGLPVAYKPLPAFP